MHARAKPLIVFKFFNFNSEALDHACALHKILCFAQAWKRKQKKYKIVTQRVTTKCEALAWSRAKHWPYA